MSAASTAPHRRRPPGNGKAPDRVRARCEGSGIGATGSDNSVGYQETQEIGLASRLAVDVLALEREFPEAARRIAAEVACLVEQVHEERAWGDHRAITRFRQLPDSPDGDA